ncbi:MAG: YceI family protein [Dehalococcoidia bacterium]
MPLRTVLIALTGLVVALAVIGAASWWFLIREDSGLATAPPEIPSELAADAASPDDAATATPDASAGTPAAGDSDVLVFSILPEESQAAYFVDEELASLPLPSTAKGVTSEIEGEFYLTGDGAALADGYESQFTVDLRNLTSDEDRRDNRVQEALETDAYPFATFTVTAVSGYDASIADGEEQTLELTGTLDLHGVQREVTWEVQAFRQGNVVSALATVTIAFADFEVTPPTFAGLVSIDDQATLQVELIAQAA